MPDLTSPEAAVRSLEDAYRRRDLDGALACKDFLVEAQLMLYNMNSEEEADEDTIWRTAQVLEQSFRAQIEAEGFPDMTGVVSSFPDIAPVSEDFTVVTEVCTYPNGSILQQKLLVVRTPAGWKVLVPLDETAA